MQIVFLFYDGMTALDAIGPHEILCRLPQANTLRVAKNPGSIRTDSAGLLLTADYGLSEVTYADVLVVPGAGNATSLREHTDILDWIRSIHSTATWTTSICTGSLILGAANLLQGLKATTHWAALDRLRVFGAYPAQERVVEDGKVMTAAGVSAGIDMALTLACKLAGAQVAQALQLGLEYDPAPPFDVGSPKKANPIIREALLARMQALFEEQPEKES